MRIRKLFFSVVLATTAALVFAVPTGEWVQLSAASVTYGTGTGNDTITWTMNSTTTAANPLSQIEWHISHVFKDALGNVVTTVPTDAYVLAPAVSGSQTNLLLTYTPNGLSRAKFWYARLPRAIKANIVSDEYSYVVWGGVGTTTTTAVDDEITIAPSRTVPVP